MPTPRKPAESRPKRPPATTPEAREQQLVALAVDMAEEQLANRKASAQVITHYLKLASVREELEREKLRGEIELAAERRKALAASAQNDELYKLALDAMRKYSGNGEAPDDGV